MAFNGIYAIRNKINNKVYIGQSTDIERRLKEHLRYCRSKNVRRGNRHLINSFIRYGEENFETKILSICPKNELNVRETLFIIFYASHDQAYGYNYTFGGDRSSGFKFSAQEKELMSKKQIGSLNHMYGKTHSEEWKINMSKKHNTTGFYRVSKLGNKNRPKWQYTYYQNRYFKTISRMDLFELMLYVQRNGLPWLVIDEYKAKETCLKYGYAIEDLS